MLDVQEKVEEKKEEEKEAQPTVIESVDTIQEEPRRIEPDVIEDDRTLREDLERLQILQSEVAGESDTEIEKFKCRLIEEMPLTKSQEEAVLHFKDTQSKSETGSVELRSEVVEEEEEEDKVRDHR